jgi:hypothetical protein
MVYLRYNASFLYILKMDVCYLETMKNFTMVGKYTQYFRMTVEDSIGKA